MKHLSMAWLACACTAALALAGALPARAQDGFPAKPITIIVPFAAGGTMDKLARELAEPLKAQLRQPVLVQNLTGAGGNVGITTALRAAPDGYTLVMGHNGMATSPALYRNLGYKPETDLEPLGVVVESPLVLVGQPALQAATAGDLMRWIARQPHVRLAHAGVGSGSHLCGLLLQSSLKVSFTTVPYRGNAPAMTDLLGGHVDLMCDLAGNALPHIQGGKLRALAVTSERRLAGTALADVPTTAQFGLADTELSIWFALYAPRGTPAAIQKKISEAVATATGSENFARSQAQDGNQVVRDARRTPDGHRAFLRRETARWTPVIRAAGAYAD
jgi:tripartite-type tricarboxylate transporter receptor subunit TctC